MSAHNKASISETPGYNVVVRGEVFTLSKGQITFDAPNLFTQSFLGEFSEAASRTLSLDSDPQLFSVIVDYLSGYPILPLDREELPRRMTVAKATRYLAKDADYLGLTRLSSMLAIPPQAFLEFSNVSPLSVNLMDVIRGNVGAGTHWHASGDLVDADDRPIAVRAENLMIRFAEVPSDSCQQLYLLRVTVQHNFRRYSSARGLLQQWGAARHPDRSPDAVHTRSQSSTYF